MTQDSSKTLSSRAGQNKPHSLKRTMDMIFALSDEYDPIIVLDPESGEYDWYIGMTNDVIQNTSITAQRHNLYENISIDSASIIHEEDRPRFQAFYSKENMMKIAETGITQETENRWFIHTENAYKWKYNKAVRMVDENGRVYVVVGVIDTTEKKEKEAEQEMQRQQLAEQATFTNFFLNSYISAYYVDLDTMSCKIYKQNSVQDNDYPVIANYYESLKYYANNNVHPDDRQAFLEIIAPERLRVVLSTKREFTHIFRDISNGQEKTYRMQVIRGGEESHAAFGFMDITEEIEEQNKRLQEIEKTKKLISNVATTYHAAFIVNMKDDTFETLRMDDDILGSNEHFANFTESKTFFLNYVCHPSDREMLVKELNYKTIRKKLKISETYDIEYRAVVNNETIWHIMSITHIDDDSIAIGFAHRDLEISKMHLEERRFDEYFALFVTDIDREVIKVVKNNQWNQYARVGETFPYSQMMEEMAMHLTDDARDFFLQLSKMDTVKSEFARGNKLSYIYKSPYLNNRWIDVTGYVTLRHKDGTPAEYTLGFSFADAQRADRQEMSKQIAEKQKQLEEKNAQLEEVNVRNQLLYDYANAGKWSYGIGENGEIINAKFDDNARALTDAKSRRDAMSWLESIHPDDRKKVKSGFLATAYDASGKTPYDLIYRLKDENGDYLWIKSAGRLVTHEDGAKEILGMSINITDQIEEKERQKKQLEDALALAQTASNAKSSFLFNMSHDIRTPMNAITGFTTMAKKYVNEPQKVTDYLDKIDVSGQQLLMLVNQVLEMARIESGKVEFNEQPVNIKERFDAMVTVLSEQAEVRGLKFNYALKDIKHFHVLSDDARMGQVTLNIAGNAMKYTPEGGSIDFIVKEIPSRRKGYGRYVFTVSDTGIGMSEEFQKNLFEPFAREKSSTVSKIQGTGLGLSIVKSLIDLAGGSIKVKSELGKGTTFDVTLDFRLIDNIPSDSSNEIDTNTLVSNFKGKRALLVDDNELNREIARYLLEDKGMSIEEADDGDIAVERMSKIASTGDFGHYDFILMDVQMPRMNGYEATGRIREILDPLGIHIPIIAISANAFDEDKKKSQEAGMDDHIAKPIDTEDLWVTLAKYI